MAWMDLTFLIPTRIETEDRLRNIISSVSYLLKHVPAKVIVKEVSGRNTFKYRALPAVSYTHLTLPTTPYV